MALLSIEWLHMFVGPLTFSKNILKLYSKKKLAMEPEKEH